MLYSYLGNLFISIIIGYTGVFTLVFLAHEGDEWGHDDEPYLIRYLVARQALVRGSLEGQLVVTLPEDVKLGVVDEEEFASGATRGFPTGFLLFILIVIWITIFLDSVYQLEVSGQIYGLIHTSIGSLLLVIDRFRTPPGTVTLNAESDGYGWIEIVCGFALVSIGFTLQFLALVL